MPMLIDSSRTWMIPLVLALAMAIPPAACADEPPFPHDAPWFNVTRPLTAQDLRGHVVLLDFFTPGCINCIHVLPETARLEREFRGRLLIIGVNSPKFVASQQSGNIEGFIQRYGIRHPIITDSGMVLWHHYDVFAWPTQVLLDPAGGTVGRYVGEGKYAAIRRDVIKTLAKARAAGTLRTTSLPLKPMAHGRHGLLQPGKVAVNAHYVAVSDTGHNRIILFDHSGKVLRVIGDGDAGSRDGVPARARFDGPQGLAFHGDTLYVADTGNALIRAIALPSGQVATVAGNGRHAYGVSGTHAARNVGLNSPWALESVGSLLYIAMAGDHQIWKLDLNGRRIGPFAGNGAEGIADGPPRLATFAQSSGLAYHDGALYVADPEASAIRAVDAATGNVRTLVGQGLFVFGLRNGPAAQALLQHDQGLAWLGGRLYIADTFNNAVRVLDLKTRTVSSLATGLAQPGGLAVLNPHTLLVADTNANRIVTVDIGSGEVARWATSGL
ncbi:MAG: redoxin domain-containing protein [Gammaproteobacteria bacterium]